MCMHILVKQKSYCKEYPPWMCLVSQGARSCLVLGRFHSWSFWHLPAGTKRLPHYGDFASYLCILLMTCTAKTINHVNLVFHCCRNVLQVEPANSKKCTCLHTLAICSQTSNESHAIPVSTCSSCICSKCQRASLPHQCIAEPRYSKTVYVCLAPPLHIAFKGVAPMCQMLGFPSSEDAQKET